MRAWNKPVYLWEGRYEVKAKNRHGSQCQPFLVRLIYALNKSRSHSINGCCIGMSAEMKNNKIKN